MLLHDLVLYLHKKMTRLRRCVNTSNLMKHSAQGKQLRCQHIIIGMC